MEAFISRKKRRLSIAEGRSELQAQSTVCENAEDDTTEIKLATLASLYSAVSQDILLDCLLSSNGSVRAASKLLDSLYDAPSPSKRASGFKVADRQSSLAAPYKTRTSFKEDTGSDPKSTLLTKKGQTLHLYTPEDIALHTPCSIVHNFLPAQDAEDLLKELLEEAPTFERQTFKLFDNVVQSPHSACFYVESLEERKRQSTEYLYNGSFLTDIRQITPHMRAVSSIVKTTVNEEIAHRIETSCPNGKKLKYQSAKEWTPNAAFVNCYKGGAESVGYHSDQLTYLGPRAVIGSLSLGVAREFRVRKIVARPQDDGASGKRDDGLRADAEGQIAIHLPHNSLLVMHAEMQEEWKHSIHPAQAIVPHPVAGNKRINITYRHYREDFHPRYTPKCKCNIATVLRCVQRKKENHGRYMWMCHVGNTPGKDGCSFFQWAEFDDDGNPPWVKEKLP
ncbi:hypothetical protein MMC17_004488 [Xylographa soralifera]|nr:hypothetical protein [Xylographa soralifera]